MGFIDFFDVIGLFLSISGASIWVKKSSQKDPNTNHPSLELVEKIPGPKFHGVLGGAFNPVEKY